MVKKPVKKLFKRRIEKNVSKVLTEENGLFRQELKWIKKNDNGKYLFQLPEGAVLMTKDRVAHFPLETVNRSFVFPENLEFQPDGSLKVTLPPGVEYLDQSNTLILPEGSIPVQEFPGFFMAHKNPDSSVTAYLPEYGVEIDFENNYLTLHNDVVNKVMPHYFDVLTDGSMMVSLPPKCKIKNDEIEMSEEQFSFYSKKRFSFVNEFDWIEENENGSLKVEPLEGMKLNGELLHVPYSMVNSLPFF